MIEATMIEGGTSCWGDRYRNYPSLYYGVQQYILLHSTPRINISNIKPLSPFSTSPACHPMGALCRYIITTSSSMEGFKVSRSISHSPWHISNNNRLRRLMDGNFCVFMHNQRQPDAHQFCWNRLTKGNEQRTRFFITFVCNLELQRRLRNSSQYLGSSESGDLEKNKANSKVGVKCKRCLKL